ncbi:MAG: hypothetical protein AAB566_00805 [Patescibacteria group bacterium]
MDFQVTPLEPTAPMPSPSFWKRRRGKIIGGAVGLLVLFLVWSIFLGRSNFSEAKVDFKIDGPTEISSGELVSYKISYKNGNKAGLNDVKLTFFYPPDAVPVRDGNIVGTTNENITFGNLGSGEVGERIITAYLVGDRGNIKTAKAVLVFKPENVQSSFKKETSVATTITQLAIPLTLVAPPSVINGQNITYLVDYRNQAQQNFNDLRFAVKYPDGFRFSNATPAPSAGQNIWDLKTLKQSQGARITIQGVLRGEELSSKLVSLVLQKKVTTPNGDVYVDFEKVEATSVIANPFLSVSLNVNDSANYTAHLGDDLQYLINFKNSSNVDISNLTLTATLEGVMFDPATVRSNAFFDGRNNTVSWNASVIPELALLRPGQSGQAAFAVRLKNSFSGGTGSANSLVKVTARLESPNIPANLDIDKLAADDQLITRISSAPSFDQKILLNDSAFGSSGPFPPKVNQKTVFTVRWQLVNPANDLSPAKVTAVLAPGVKWENRVRSGANQPPPGYDSRTSAITWDLSTLPGGSGVGLPKYEAFFQISITPSVNQVGQAPPLLKNTRFDGIDAFTKENISRSVQDSTTYNIDDSNENGSVEK